MAHGDAEIRRWPGRRLVLAVTLPLVGIIVGIVLWSNRSPHPRLLLVGIDGADWAVIDRLRTEGRLPNLDGLIRDGTSGPLRSMEPLLSPVIWTTIATGHTADRHGVTWFMVDNPNTGGRMPITSSTRRVKAFWNLLDEAELRTGVIGWWATWPAEQIDGFIVSDFLAYHGFGVSGHKVDTDVGRTHPPELLAEIDPLLPRPEAIGDDDLARFVDLPPDELAELTARPFEFAEPIHHLRNILATASAWSAVATSQAEHLPTEVLAVYFEAIDSTSHLFMRHADPPLAGIDAAERERFRRAVDEMYVYQDELIGRLLSRVDDRTTVMIVSDHGFKTGADRPLQAATIDVPTAHLWHTLDGILIARGPHVKRGARIDGAGIADITPTLLHALGLPRGDDMAGHVLHDLFETDWMNRHPVATIPSWEGDDDDRLRPDVADAGSAVAADVEARLRALGYIGDDRPASSEVHDNLGNIQLRRGDVGAALAEFERAVAADPSSANPHRNLGAVYRRLGRTSEARRELELTLRLAPDAHPVRVELGDLDLEAGDLDGAVTRYGAALLADPDLVTAIVGVGNVLRMRGDDAGARARFERALELQPEWFVPHYNLGVLAQAAGDVDAARAHYERAAELAPNQAVIHNNLGHLAERSGDADAAIAHYRAARDVDPQHFESRYNLGTMLLRRDDLDGAAQALKEALALRPDHVFAHNNLATVYMRRGWTERALREYDAITKLQPDQPEAWFQVARLWAAGDHDERARASLERALALGGSRIRVAARTDPLLRDLVEDATAP